jgi:hypothetical protein
MSASKKMNDSYSNTQLGPFSSRRFFTTQVSSNIHPKLKIVQIAQDYNTDPQQTNITSSRSLRFPQWLSSTPVSKRQSTPSTSCSSSQQWASPSPASS